MSLFLLWLSIYLFPLYVSRAVIIMAPKSLYCVFIYNNRLYAYNTPIHPVLPADLSYIQSMLLTNDRKILMGAEVDFCCPQTDGGAVSPKIHSCPGQGS